MVATVMYRDALVVGLGVSGTAAARALLEQGTSVTAVDSGSGAELAKKAEHLQAAGARVELGCRTAPAGVFEVCIVSPGVPPDSALVREVEGRGISVISELELGARLCRVPMLAVTGTNGKSTAVKLCSEALTAAGLRTVAAGNYGLPLCEAVAQDDLDWVVVEVSSFQLERVVTFSPAVGVLLNVQPDHLDRHGTMAAYRQLKARLFGAMEPGARAIVPDEERLAIARLEGGERQWTTFGASADCDYRFEGSCVWYSEAAHMHSVPFENTPFMNPVLGLTAAACVAAVRACGMDAGAVAEAARAFEPLPHRMQTVGVIDGVRFIDDSKATNLAALSAALEMAGDGVRLIAGGLLKEKCLNSVKEVLEKRVGGLYLIGDATEEMVDAWAGTVPCRRCGDLESATRSAWRDAVPGETVLLSPGCASFDQFRNFEERGDRFKEIVRSIHEES